MVTLSTSRLTSRGQIVIPEEIRERLGLKQGAQFIVMGEGDAIILKTIASPSVKDSDEILARTAAAAKREGMRQSDIKESIKNYRTQRKNRESHS